MIFSKMQRVYALKRNRQPGARFFMVHFLLTSRYCAGETPIFCSWIMGRGLRPCPEWRAAPSVWHGWNFRFWTAAQRISL